MAAQRLFGYTAEQAVGRNISMLIPADRLDEEKQIITRLSAGERIEHYATLRLGKGGQEIPVSLTISPVKDEYGKVIMVSKIVRDITDRREAEKALRRNEKNLADFFNNAPVCVRWIGADGIILRANRTELELLGYSADEYVGRHIADFHADKSLVLEKRLQNSNPDQEGLIKSSSQLKAQVRAASSACFKPPMGGLKVRN